MLVLVGLTACGRAAPPTSDAALAAERSGMGAAGLNPVSGTVFALKPAGDVLVRLYSVGASNGELGHKLAEGRTNADGTFRLDAGTYEGPALVEADVTPALALQLALANVAMGSTATHWSVTPITTLASTYAGFLTRNGVTWENAVTQASNAIDGHFLGFRHATVVPAAWPVESGAPQGPCQLEQASMRASLLGWGLATEGVAHLQIGEQKLTPEEGLAQMIVGLQEDLRGDGRWDGSAPSKKLPQNFVALDAEAARDRLAEAIADFLASPANQSNCTPDEAWVLTERLRRSQMAPLTALKPRPEVLEIPQAPPPKPSVQCEVRDEDGTERQFDDILRGVLQVDCRWEAEGGLERVGLDGHENSVWLTPRPNEDPHLVSFLLDTRLAEEVLQLRRIRVGIRGEDAFGQSTVEDLFFSVRNEAPTLQIQSIHGDKHHDLDASRLWWRENESFSITARVPKSVRSVEMYVDDVLQMSPSVSEAADGEDDAVDFTLVAHLDGCDRQARLVLVATDDARNVSRKEMNLFCAGRQPEIQILPQAWQHDWPEDGQQTYLWQGKSTTQIQKFFHKLDHDPEHGRTVTSQNLPVLRFRVSDPGGALAGKQPRVRYAYRFVGADYYRFGAKKEAWRDYEDIPEKEGVYEVVISYQDLLPRETLARSVEEIRRENFLSSTLAGDLHEINLLVESATGDTIEKKIPFWLLLRGPTVVLEDFHFTADVNDAPYEHALDVLKSGRELVEASARYDLRADTFTLFRLHKAKVQASIAASVDSETELIEQWDRGDAFVGDYSTYRGNWPPNKCRDEQRIFTPKGTNACWSQSRGCHLPLQDGYPADRSIGVSLVATNGPSYAARRDVLKPRNWAHIDSRQANVIVGEEVTTKVSFDIPFRLSHNAKWRVSEGRNGARRRYHVLSEDSFYFHGNRHVDLHVFTTDYYVESFVATIRLPSAVNLKAQSYWMGPKPYGIILGEKEKNLVRSWRPSATDNFQRKRRWPSGMLPDYSRLPDENSIAIH